MSNTMMISRATISTFSSLLFRRRPQRLTGLLMSHVGCRSQLVSRRTTSSTTTRGPPKKRIQQLKKNPKQQQQQQHEQELHPPRFVVTSVSNLLIFGGLFSYALVFASTYFQNRQKELVAKRQEELYKEFGDSDELAAKYENQRPLFYCVVRIKSRDITSDMFPVEIGDVVEVLEESVGKEGHLNMCRIIRQGQGGRVFVVVSPYPMGCLQKLPPQQQEQLQ